MTDMVMEVTNKYFPYSEKEKCEREYKSIRQLPEETSTDFMKRFLRLTGFLGAKAGTQEEHAKHFKWGLNDFVLDRILSTEFTDYGRSYGSSSQKGYSDYASSPPCTIYGNLHPGKACHRATGACFECGEVVHLAKDCKKG
nr:hypothetical protein [Tanacetum cinerariifolium]